MIKEKEVKCVMKRLYCDNCGTEMQHTGEVLLTCPEKYPHKCPKCGYQEIEWKRFPLIDYVEVEDQP